MKHIFPIIAVLAATLFITAPAMGAVVTTYNQTYDSSTNFQGGSNIWTAVAAWQSVWAVKGGAQVLIVNTSTTTSANGIDLTLKKGPFFRGFLGDKVFTMRSNRTYILGPFELARFKQQNGTLVFSSNATRGKILSISAVS